MAVRTADTGAIAPPSQSLWKGWRRLSFGAWIMLILGTIDTVYTLYVVLTGSAVEGAPLAGFYLQQGIGPFIGFRVLIVGGVVAVFEIERHRAAAHGGIVGWLGVRTFTFGMWVGVVAYLALYAYGSWKINTDDATRYKDATTRPVPRHHAPAGSRSPRHHAGSFLASGMNAL